ncbi:Uncharacterised protein [Mycobacterium tuberculosis]|nr:Uncharacterised protein [Mycobacterium tuberculosis]CNW13488.1 Uncharacterised protein [Mycobacterium tuberculosis]COY06878.1 Uncharacterised protein [Mycobacterium tuberculosis]
MMIGSVVIAKAPVTPSKEKAASSTSRYRNNAQPAFPAACLACTPGVASPNPAGRNARLIPLTTR